jgi:predicted MFS family arabinose efflux permease
MFFTASYLGSVSFLPLYLQRLQGSEAFVSGLALTVGGVMWTVGSLVATRGHGRWPGRMVRIGALLIALTSAYLAAQALFGPWPVIFVYVIWGFGAFGMGMGMIHLTNSAIVAAPADQKGTVSSAVQTVRTLGVGVGSALMGALLELFGTEGEQLRLALAAIFALAAVIALWPATFGRPSVPERS